MAVVSRISRLQGVNAFTLAYAATSAPELKSFDGAVPMHVCYEELTGAMTINAGVSRLMQFQEVTFYFTADASERVVTFGTGFISSGTVTIAATKSAVARGVYDGAAIRILSREIEA